MQISRLKNMSYQQIREKVDRLKLKGIRNVAKETRAIRPGAGYVVKAIYNIEKEEFTNYSFSPEGSHYCYNHRREVEFIFNRPHTMSEIKDIAKAVLIQKLDIGRKI